MYKSKPNLRFRLANLAIGLFVLCFAIICVYPVLHVLFASLSNPSELVMHTGLLLHPQGFSLRGYQVAVNHRGIWTGYLNTFFVVTVGLAVNMLLTIMAAYVLSRKELYLRRFLNLFVIFTMYFGGGIIPSYILVKNLGLINSRAALILPVAINTYNMIILRTSINEIPSSLLDAARIDGAGDMAILFKVVVPLVKPTLAVLVLYYMVQHWNSWFNAMLYIRDRDKFPLQLVIREIVFANSVQMDIAGMAADLKEKDQARHLVKYCATIIATVPILCIYPFLQKYFVKGILIGSVKE